MHLKIENLAYTNKYFNSRESIQVETNNNAMFGFESVKETCVIEPKNICYKNI
jgi:hypothetical protein